MLDPAKEATLGKIVSGLEDGSAKLTSWRRVRTLFLQLPPVAAALPVLVAALADPLSDVQRGSVAEAGLVMLVSVALVYLIVVWPSLKLGFRGKRAIFSGGEDLAHPLMYQPGKATWRGFPVNEGPVSVDIVDYCRLLLAFLFRRRDGVPDAVADQVSTAADSSGSVPAVAAEDLADQPRLENFPRAAVDRQRALRYAAKAVSDARLLEFPHVQVYRDEDEVFNHLGRRKLEEVPIDLFLSLGPYLALLVTGSSVVTYIAYLMRVGAGENPYLLALAPLMVLFSVLPAQMVLQLRANLWLRRRRWEVPAAGRGRQTTDA